MNLASLFLIQATDVSGRVSGEPAGVAHYGVRRCIAAFPFFHSRRSRLSFQCFLLAPSWAAWQTRPRKEMKSGYAAKVASPQ